MTGKVASKSRSQWYLPAMLAISSGVGSVTCSKDLNRSSSPAGEMISRTTAGSSEAFQKVCHCPARFEDQVAGVAEGLLAAEHVAAMSSTDSASSQPPTIHWKGQNRLPGW
jgi:hypothetical protein